MGVASLMIIACHASASHVLMPDWLNMVLDYGNVGVDIFLFLSGVGLYYSFKKTPIQSIIGVKNYLNKRSSRIFIPYWLVYLPYCIVLLLLRQYTIGDSLMCLGAIEYWFYHRGAWFVSLILILYLFAPLLFTILNSKFKWIYVLLFIVAISIICQLPLGEPHNNNIIYNIQFALSRVPSFIVGMAVGDLCQENKKISSVWLFLLFVIGLLSIKSFPNRGCAIWMTIPFVLYLILLIIKVLATNVWINKILTFMGIISLESYLTNISINSLLETVVLNPNTSLIFYGKYLQYIIVISVGITAAFFVNRLAKQLTERYLRVS